MDKREKLAYEIQSYINSHKPEGFEDFEVEENEEQGFYWVSSINEDETNIVFKIEEDMVSVIVGVYNFEFDKEKATEVLEVVDLHVYLLGESGDNSFLMLYPTDFDNVAKDIPNYATALLEKMLETACLIIYLTQHSDEIRILRDDTERRKTIIPFSKGSKKAPKIKKEDSTIE